MSSGPERFAERARALGFEAEVHVLDASTRTAAEAAEACGCAVAQIVKSLVFETGEGALVLLLVSGANQVDVAAFRAHTGLGLSRADIKRVRAEAGFAIGGVPPFGHDAPLRTFIDGTLQGIGPLWAAAGAPNAVFPVSFDDLVRVSGGEVCAVC